MIKQKGFTLLEMVLVIILSSILSVIVFKILAHGLSAFLTASNLSSADQQARLAMERMSRDIRGVRSPSDITTATASQFTFNNSAGTNISYTLSGSTLNRNTQPLAQGINILTFTYYDNNGNTTATLTAIRYIKIALNITQGNTNFTVTTALYPENLP